MATNKNFQLRSSEIIQILENPEFFSRCVAFLFFKDQALAAVSQYHKALVEKEEGCNGCDQQHGDESRYVKPVIGMFVTTIRQLHEIDPSHLKPVRDFISEKLGYQPGTISLYYKQSGRTQSLEF